MLVPTAAALTGVDGPMGNKHDWRGLLFILGAGLVVGWISGQLVSLIPSQDGAAMERPRLSPR
jgi:hypothetical protein